MAPSHSTVHSAEHGRALSIASPRSRRSLSYDQAFDLRLKVMPPHKREQTPWVELSLNKTDNQNKYLKSNETHCVGSDVIAPSSYPLQVKVEGLAPVNLALKAEPNSDHTSCSLLKSFYRANGLPTPVPKLEPGTEFVIKVEPDQDLKPGPETGIFDQKNPIPSSVTVPNVFTGKPQTVYVYPQVSSAQHHSDTHNPSLLEKHQIATKAPHVGYCPSHDSRILLSTPTSIRNIVRPSLVDRQQIVSYSKPASSYYLRLLRTPHNRLTVGVVAHPTPDFQPPEDDDPDLPNNQAAPQPPSLLKSLYGLSQCLNSLSEIPGSSLNPSNTSNTPGFNQAHFNSSQGSNTGGPHGSSNNSAEFTTPGAEESNDVDLASLDPPSLYELGTFLRTLALQLGGNSGNAGTSQSHVPYSFHAQPSDPGWRMHMNDPGIHNAFSASSQPRFAEPYPGSYGSSQPFSAGASGSRLPTGDA
ncbi:unnamed protein product [Rhizoctonia solani]|uniref:Uncharacterized protein n=1 Tax=Rhizoctonia solani TaxID=456999 RepID=A0A8H3I6D4_9AGAM|nr:unnamed protein product [Rhizoctonia solani]